MKLADFGAVNIVKASGLGTTTTDITPTRQCTLLYVAPEFLSSGKANPAADIYRLENQ